MYEMYVCMHACMHACMHVRMYFPQKHGFSNVFAKRTSINIEFFQIFGKRMQEAQASKKAGRGNRAWDPWRMFRGYSGAVSRTSDKLRMFRGQMEDVSRKFLRARRFDRSPRPTPRASRLFRRCFRGRFEDVSAMFFFCDTGSPKTTFSGTSSNCRAVRGGPPKVQVSK